MVVKISITVGRLINQAIANTEIMDILAAAGMNQPNLRQGTDAEAHRSKRVFVHPREGVVTVTRLLS